MSSKEPGNVAAWFMSLSSVTNHRNRNSRAGYAAGMRVPGCVVRVRNQHESGCMVPIRGSTNTDVGTNYRAKRAAMRRLCINGNGIGVGHCPPVTLLGLNGTR